VKHVSKFTQENPQRKQYFIMVEKCESEQDPIKEAKLKTN